MSTPPPITDRKKQAEITNKENISSNIQRAQGKPSKSSAQDLLNDKFLEELEHENQMLEKELQQIFQSSKSGDRLP